MTKLHPSIVISTRDKSSVYVNGVLQLFRVTEDEAYDYASTVSDTLWIVDVTIPARPHRTPRGEDMLWM
jgi:hypothetical protein